MSLISLAKNAVKDAATSIFDVQESPLTNTHTRCVARFFPFKARNTLTEDDTDAAMESEEIIEDDSIVACAISKDKSSPADSFQITLKPNKNYGNLIRPGDWVILYLDDIKNIDVKNLKGVKCIGNVDRVAKSVVTLQNGDLVTTYNIHGSGWGKFFEVTEMFYNPFAPQEFKEIFTIGIGFNFTGTPQDFVNKYLDVYFGDAKKQNLENTLFLTLIPPKLFQALKIDDDNKDRSKNSAVSFNDVMLRKFNDNTKEGFSNFRSISRLMSGSLWNTLKQCCNTMLNEMYTDVRNGKPVLVYRKMPLTSEIRQSIVDEGIIDVSKKYIVNTELGFSDHDVFNYLTVLATDSLITDITYLTAATNAGVDLPRVAKDSTKRYGLRRIELNTEYAIDKDTTGNIKWDAIKKWCDELEQHWFNYYHYENGTIQLKGLYDFQLGQFIRIPEEKKLYMVNSITWDWNFGDVPVVSLTLIYGHLEEDGAVIDIRENSEKVLTGTGNYTRVVDKKLGPEPTVSSIVRDALG